jgi:hypothetical protein
MFHVQLIEYRQSANVKYDIRFTIYNKRKDWALSLIYSFNNLSRYHFIPIQHLKYIHTRL